LDTVVGHLKGHAADLEIPLGELVGATGVASYEADGAELIHKTELAAQTIGYLLASIGLIAQDSGKFVARIAVYLLKRDATFDTLFYNLEGKVFLLLKLKDITKEFHVLLREETIPPSSTREVEEPTAFQVTHLANREGGEILPKTGYHLAYGVLITGTATLLQVLDPLLPSSLDEFEPVFADLDLVSIPEIHRIHPNAVYIGSVKAARIADSKTLPAARDLGVLARNGNVI
jgi:hypothetical protein